MDESTHFGMSREDILGTLMRRWKPVTGVLIAGIVLTGVLALFEKPTYQAFAKLMVTSERARITVSPDPRSGSIIERVTDQDLNSEVALLQSPSLLREVLEPSRSQFQERPPSSVVGRVLAFLRSPLDLGTYLLRQQRQVAPPSPFDEWLESTSKHLSIQTIKGSNLIEVSYAGADPKWSAQLVNDLVQHHVERHARLSQQTAALEFLESQRQLLDDKMRRAEADLADFYSREGVDATASQRIALRARLAELESRLGIAEIELAETQARVEVPHLGNVLPERNAATTSSSSQQDPLQLIRSRIMELQLQRADLVSKLAPGSLKLEMLDHQLEEAKHLLTVEAKKTSQEFITAAKARVTALRTQIAADQTKLRHLDQIAPEGERLEQELATARESFLTYSKKAEEARFSNALDQSRIVNVSVVERAEVPSVPKPSRSMLTLLLGAIMSLAASAGFGLLLDRLDPTVETAAVIERITGMKILAEIPS